MQVMRCTTHSLHHLLFITEMRTLKLSVWTPFKLFQRTSKACSYSSIPNSSGASTVSNSIRGTFKPVLPGVVSERRSVPAHIATPEYAFTGAPFKAPSQIALFDGEDLQKMRVSAQLARDMLDFASSLVQAGISTEEIDRLTHEKIVSNNAYPSPVNYAGFPKSICTSVNEVCCHGIPDSRILEEGDIISIDVSVYKDGFHGDNCTTVIVGDKCDDRGKELIYATQEALNEAISICGPGAQFLEIGDRIQRIAKDYRLEVQRQFMGHGVGSILHMSPLVAHYRNLDSTKMRPGMIFTIEPIFLEGSHRCVTWPDNWSSVAADFGRSAQFEHEVLITETGHEILTVPSCME